MVLILIFSEVLGLYGYVFIAAAVPTRRIADASTGQTHRRTDNEHQGDGCKVSMIYVTVSLSPARYDLRPLISTEQHEQAPEIAMHIYY